MAIATNRSRFAFRRAGRAQPRRLARNAVIAGLAISFVVLTAELRWAHAQSAVPRHVDPGVVQKRFDPVPQPAPELYDERARQIRKKAEQERMRKRRTEEAVPDMGNGDGKKDGRK
ncbi:MAG: hypothetical protein O7H40_07530 [Gammaproteobacteria bacterium]|nr:hypothetical protein [Gammaproteobacteria bacterium]